MKVRTTNLDDTKKDQSSELVKGQVKLVVFFLSFSSCLKLPYNNQFTVLKEKHWETKNKCFLSFSSHFVFNFLKFFNLYKCYFVEKGQEIVMLYWVVIQSHLVWFSLLLFRIVLSIQDFKEHKTNIKKTRLD